MPREIAECAFDVGEPRRRHLPIMELVDDAPQPLGKLERSEEHTSELQSLMRISYAVFCLNKKINIMQSKYNTSTLNQHPPHTTTRHPYKYNHLKHSTHN